MGLAVAANYGPLTHYVDARSRLEKRTSEVATLAAKNAELQTRLSKLLQPGYLEELARQELTYSLPGEDLFIVTGESTTPTDGTGAGGLGVGGSASRSDPVGANGASGSTTVSGTSDQTTPGDGDNTHPGFLERLLSGIANLF